MNIKVGDFVYFNYMKGEICRAKVLEVFKDGYILIEILIDKKTGEIDVLRVNQDTIKQIRNKV